MGYYEHENPHPHTASYRTCACGNDCDYVDQATETQPCWGRVEAVDQNDWGDGEYSWVHACKGHAGPHKLQATGYCKENE